MGARRRGGQEAAVAPYPGKYFFFLLYRGPFCYFFTMRGPFCNFCLYVGAFLVPVGSLFGLPPFLRLSAGAHWGINVPSLPPRTAVCSSLFFFKKILYTPRVLHCLCASFAGINDKSALFLPTIHY